MQYIKIFIILFSLQFFTYAQLKGTSKVGRLIPLSDQTKIIDKTPPVITLIKPNVRDDDSLKVHFSSIELEGALFYIVYESCFCGYWIYDHFNQRGYKIIVIPTNRIYRNGSIVKTDKIDSRKLAFQHSRGLLREVKVSEIKIREYRLLFRIYNKEKMRQGQILRQIRSILETKNYPLKWERFNKEMERKLKGIMFQERIFNKKFTLLLKEYEYVNEQIKDTEDRIKEIAEDKELSGRIKRIDKIQGIVIISSIRLVVNLFDRRDRFESGEKLVHYLGLTPGEHSSGEEIKRGKTGLVGNRQLRSIIIQLAWVAVRKDGDLLNKFERVYRSSGCKQKAIVAVARKMMM